MASALKQVNQAPGMTVGERDRRYSEVRKGLREQGLDGVIASGSHLLYLSGGLPGEMFGLLPADDNEHFEALISWRHLVDIPHSVMTEWQDWVKHVRSGRNIAPMAERIRELHLENGKLGYVGPFGHQAYSMLTKELPGLQLIDATAILNNARTIKSPEEIALIDRANSVFDSCVERIQAEGRPGMLGREVVQIGMNAIWDAGGDIHSGFSLNFGPEPAQNPVLAEICLEKRIQEGDIGTLTAHTHFHHYGGHSDQEIVFGEPKPRHVKMFDAVKKVRAEVLRHVRAGVTQRELFDVYEATCKDVGYLTSEHAQMHQYGIDIPEFPGPAFRIDDPKGGKGLGGGGNFTLTTGMIYSISPTLIDKATGETLLGGTSLAVSDDGYQELGHRRDVEILVAA